MTEIALTTEPDQLLFADWSLFPGQLLFDAEQTSALLGADSNGQPNVSAYWLKRKGAARLIPCTEVAGKLRWSRKNISDLLDQLSKGPGALLCTRCQRPR